MQAKPTTTENFDRKNYYSVSDLKDKFRMTDTIIAKMKVSVTRTNPFYRSAAPMKFYLKTYVTRFFKTKRFLAWKEGNAKRAASVAKMKATVQAKSTAALQDGLEQLIIDVKPKHLISTIKAAFSEKQQFDMNMGRFDCDITTAPLSVKHRWVVNYIRHRRSNYEEVYTSLRRKDHDDVKAEINAKIEALLPGIDDAILRVFPNTPVTEVK